MSFAYKVSAANRDQKWALFEDRMRPDAEMNVLDVGFSENEYSATDNYIEKFYPYPARLTALGVDEPVAFAERYPEVTAVRYDGRTFPFGDKTFDICWSNAVVEHVGDADRQVEFLSEIRRVSRRAFLTTPNRWFPAEVHTRTPFLHWLPKDTFDAYLRGVGKSWAAGEYMHLLSERQLRERLGLAGFTRYELVKSRLLGVVMTFSVIAECD